MDISPAQGDWVPDACTLPTVEQPIRLAEFDQFFADRVTQLRRPDATRVELVLAAEAESAGRDLAARESRCCSFFTFDFDATTAGLVMSVSVPETYVGVLDAFATRVRSAIGEER
ncbi:hypothetical protein [Nocardia nova]|uniref:Arsenate reductase n=1 Tax=Nocardia nova TaxID=37330 RepID=A0A2S6A0M4_9NOCA|nr:hypothetical protein [Nocardia nova]PPJ24732.1 hypothetical protein C5F51_24455 [Nocardia nova]